MIKYNPKIWFGHIANIHKSDSLRMLWKELIIMTLYTAILAYLGTEYWSTNNLLKETTIVHSLIGFVLSLLLVFRTNTAYDRWWEGRKHWGAMVNNTRNLASKLNGILPENAKEVRMFFAKMIPNYAYAMKEHLREGVKIKELENCEHLFDELEAKEHIPNYISTKMYKKIHQIKRDGIITEEEQLMVDKEMKAFTDIIGACERIKNTPIPFSYSLFLKKFLFIYVLSIPIGFVAQFEYWTIPISVFIFYVLVSLEVLAEEIEDPFGRDSNDLNTDELCEKIRKNVQELLYSNKR